MRREEEREPILRTLTLLLVKRNIPRLERNLILDVVDKYWGSKEIEDYITGVFSRNSHDYVIQSHELY